MIKKQNLYRGTAVFTAIFALFAVFMTVQLVSADETSITGNVDGSSKTVNDTTPEAGDTVRYTVTISNSDSLSTVTMTDTLPVGATYAGNFVETPAISGSSYITTSSMISWTSQISANVEVELSFDVVLTNTLIDGTVLTNTALIDNGAVITRSAALTITTPPVPDFSASYKMADTVISYPGDIIEYTVVVSNTGTGGSAHAIVTDTLPLKLTYVPGTLTSTTSMTYTISGQVLSWQADIDAGTEATFYFQAEMASGATLGDVITNVVEIDDGAVVVIRTAAVTIDDFQIYLPVILTPPPIPTLSATRPNSSNSWSLNWTVDDDTNVTGYTIQESSTPDFVSILSETTLNSLTQAYSHALNTRPIYYYRVRSHTESNGSNWSNVVRVVGGYHDNFSDSSSGWTPLRRMTYLEKTDVKYGTGSEAGNLIILTFDLWDWALASPLVPAPQVPYNITYRARVHDGSNLVSGGAAFGGDWAGQECPDYGGNPYNNDHCFNHFYNFNYIWHGGGLKLLHEQVDSLYYCPSCDGSLLKRLGPTIDAGDVIGVNNRDKWHTYRMEVRNSGTTLYIDGSYIRHFPNTSWIHEPYFGVFSSTFEYEPSIWFFDYFEVKPVD